MVALNLCSCDACKKIGQLKVKFVAHLGEVAQQEIAGKTHLAGVAVITVHRMLKNAVPVPEYVLMTQQLHEQWTAENETDRSTIEEDLEGLGPATLHFTDLAEIALEPAPPPRATLPRRVGQLMDIGFRGFPTVVGLRRPNIQVEDAPDHLNV